jgi:hypothetical protein
VKQTVSVDEHIPIERDDTVLEHESDDLLLNVIITEFKVVHYTKVAS